MYQDNKIWIGRSGDEKVYIYPSMANRHGMIAGATGTGKTVTLKVIAESFSDCGVPVFLADVKGDLAGICKPGEMTENLQSRIEKLGLAQEGFEFKAYPTSIWDVYQENGIPLRTTISEMGPILLAKILGLTPIQSDILTVAFKIADEESMALIDTKDLRLFLQYLGDNAREYALRYGNMSKQSLAAIIRSIVALEAEGADKFFFEPAINVTQWFTKNRDGKGTVNLLDCRALINSPNMYSTFMLWLLSELFEELPEVGDAAYPRMVFFFDEAHLLFQNASKELLTKIEQIIKLIRSKGVGVFFITQSPKDIPNGVLAQLGNKVQHALHAYTPAEQTALKAAAMSFRENPEFSTIQELQNLAVGEALVSVLDEEGVPTIVKKTKILPPQSRMGAITDGERTAVVEGDNLYLQYKNEVDRESAYEILSSRMQSAAEETARQAEEAAAAKAKEKEEAAAAKQAEKDAAAAAKKAEKEAAAAAKEAEKKKNAQTRQVKNAVKSVANTTAGTIGREVGNNLGKSVGGTFGKKLGGNVGASIGRGIIGTLFRS